MANSAGSPPVRRRWLSFSLRGLLLLTLAVALALTGFKWRAERAERQRHVVAKLRLMQQEVHYDYRRWSRGNMAYSGESPIPKSLRNWLGEDFFHNVTTLYTNDDTLNGGSVVPESEEFWECLASLPHIENLGLAFKSISREEVQRLSCLPRLKRLSIFESQLDEAASVALLKATTQMQEFNVFRSEVHDQGLLALASHGNLTSLSLEQSNVEPFTGITDEGLVGLKNCRRLKEVKINRVGCGDGLLQAIGACSELETLEIQFGHATDDGLRHLADCQKLSMLFISEQPITDEGLRQVQSLPNLKYVCFPETHVRGHNLADFVAASQFHTLALRKARIDDEFLAGVHKFSALATLDLTQTEITTAGMQVAIFPPALANLSLAETKLGAGALTNLQGRTGLRVETANTGIPDEEVSNANGTGPVLAPMDKSAVAE